MRGRRRRIWVGWVVFAVALIAVVAALAGNKRSGQTPAAGSSLATTSHRPHGRVARRRHKRSRPRPHRQHTATLPFSTASPNVVQPQPAPGSCHARGSGPYTLPDPRCTPGALNPAVTQATIATTICVSGWTDTVRPPESVTEPEKQASMAAYGDSGSASDYEYDHLVPLELGGALNDPRNLWPEPGATPNPKDGVEEALHQRVCSGEMTLSAAQQIIARRWVAWAKSNGFGAVPASPTAPPKSTSSTPASGSSPNKPISEINCSDFPTHAAAQQWFEAHGGSSSNDVAGLDGDHDGIACESLP